MKEAIKISSKFLSESCDCTEPGAEQWCDHFFCCYKSSTLMLLTCIVRMNNKYSCHLFHDIIDMTKVKK